METKNRTDANTGNKYSSKKRRKAVTHVANKMMTIIWYMLVSKNCLFEESRTYTMQNLRGSRRHKLIGWSEQQNIV
jgi:hypothetical protein